MRVKVARRTVRRSVALSRQLVDEVVAVAPPELRQNLNRLVTVALQEFASQRKARAFEDDMARMAADPAIRAECATISKAFAITEGDGLRNDPPRPGVDAAVSARVVAGPRSGVASASKTDRARRRERKHPRTLPVPHA